MNESGADKTRGAARGGLREAVNKKALDLGIDKIITVAAGAATALLGSIFVPMGRLTFHQYDPFPSFLDTYWMFCAAIVAMSVATWSFALYKWPYPKALGVHALFAAVALLISGLMSMGAGLPTVIWIQFLLYFAGIVVIGELALVGFGLIACRVWRWF